MVASNWILLLDHKDGAVREKEMKSLRTFLLVVTLVILISGTAVHSGASSAKEDVVKRLQASAEVLQQIMDTPDKGIPEEVMNGAKCVVVVPHLMKGGFVVGAKHGRGVASCRTSDKGWSAPAFVSVGGGSFGFQIGVEGVDLVMLVMNEKGLQHLLSSKFQVSGEGSAAAGPVGRHASAGTDWKMNAELLTYSRSKGAFAGATIEGAVIEKDADSTKAVYGENASFQSILSGSVPTPPDAEAFHAVLVKASRQSKEAAAK
jgi:SH3 domain-containing YSC84-like protein 1